ncbi:hypothetical protein ALC57_01813 [Trachymyrmex cornetzi]|uniref:Uncharacterized protein n=1 Tax=Trachymyrmex cornetzi TaxID=471704 RepID=A0A195EKQ2_9HYME|nr:hypothetical protein ALC57_01813 [Trachymyrmex cornetzi]
MTPFLSSPSSSSPVTSSTIWPAPLLSSVLFRRFPPFLRRRVGGKPRCRRARYSMPTLSVLNGMILSLEYSESAMGVFHDVTNSYISLYCPAALFTVQRTSPQVREVPPGMENEILTTVNEILRNGGSREDAIKRKKMRGKGEKRKIKMRESTSHPQSWGGVRQRHLRATCPISPIYANRHPRGWLLTVSKRIQFYLSVLKSAPPQRKHLICQRLIVEIFCVSQPHRHAHVSRTNYELKGINRGTHCKINDLFRIEIMAAAYSRMHIPDIKHASCEMSDLQPFRLHPISISIYSINYIAVYRRCVYATWTKTEELDRASLSTFFHVLITSGLRGSGRVVWCKEHVITRSSAIDSSALWRNYKVQGIARISGEDTGTLVARHNDSRSVSMGHSSFDVKPQLGVTPNYFQSSRVPNSGGSCMRALCVTQSAMKNGRRRTSHVAG